MWRVTWRGVRSHPVRFGLSILAVLLGIAFVSGTFSLRAMMASTFNEIVDQSVTADVYVRGPNTVQESNVVGAQSDPQGNRQLVPIDVATQVERVPGVQSARADIQGTMVLVGADGTAVQQTMAPSLALVHWPNDPGAEMVSGRGPQRAGEISLETTSLKRSGLKVGDTTTVILNGEITEQKIVGEWSFNAASGGALIASFDPATATALFAADGLVPTISVVAKPDTDPAELATRIAAALPGDSIDVVTGDELRRESKEEVAKALGFVESFLLVFAGIALFVGAFIIFNTFQMVVRQRMPEIAVLRAVGASPAQVFASVLGQAAIVGAVGSLVGVFAGLGLVRVLKAVFAQMGMELSGDIPLTATGVTLSFAFGLGVAVLSAALPAATAARVPPVEAMRDTVSAKGHSMLRWALVGSVLMAGGLAGVIGSLVADDAPLPLLGVGAVGVLFGTLALSPVIGPWVIRLLAWPFQAVRPLGRLARGNVTRNTVRTSVTAGALMVGMALVGAATVIAASTQASMAHVVDSGLKADFVLRGAQLEIPQGALDAAEDVAGVEHVDRYYFAQLLVNDEISTVSAIKADSLGDSLDPNLVEGSLADFSGRSALVSKGFAKDNDLAVGDSLSLANPQVAGSDRTVRVVGISDSMVMDAVTVTPEVYEEIVPASLRVVPNAFVHVADGAMESARAGLIDAVKPYFVVSVMDKEEFTTSLANQVNGILNVLYALLGLSIVVAVIGVVNTLALSIMERTREIGMMRAVGLGKLQLAGTITIESILIAVFGAFSGLVVGVGLGATLPTVFRDSGLTELVIPWGSLLGMLVLAAVIGVFAALWPAVHAARLPVLDAVSHD